MEGALRAATRVGAAITAALILIGGDATRAHAEGVHALQHDTRVDVAVTATAGIWYATSELMKASLVPPKCRWCYRAEDGTDRLNRYDAGVRRALIWRDTESAGFASSVLAFFVEPAAMMGLAALASGHDHAIRGFPLDALLVAEATFIAGDVNQLVKFTFARERPFVHFLPRAPSAVRALTDSPSDENTSFFSGHTTLAFAVATSAGTVSTLRGYRLTPIVWSAGLVMATTVGYLRIASDKHYLSDVITAAIAGSVIGVGVPWLFHRSADADATRATASAQALTGPAIRNAFSFGAPF